MIRTIIMTLLLFKMINAQEITPPSDQPISIKTSFHLIDLVSINDQDQNFTADIYLRFQWIDLRLAHSYPEPVVYFGKDAKEEIQKIWWPEIEFINTNTPEITNEILFIYPNGEIKYQLGITSTFRADFDFRKFPFDKQILPIRIKSFVWNDKIMRFEIETTTHLENKNVAMLFRERKIEKLILEIKNEQVSYGDAQKEFQSVFEAKIIVKRKPAYYILQIIFPLFLMIIFTSFVFFIDIKEIADRLILLVTCVLTIFALKFIVNQDLPKIEYLSIIHYLFFLTYICCAVFAIFCVIESLAKEKKLQGIKKLNRKIEKIAPCIFIAIFLLVLFYGLIF